MVRVTRTKKSKASKGLRTDPVSIFGTDPVDSESLIVKSAPVSTSGTELVDSVETISKLCIRICIYNLLCCFYLFIGSDVDDGTVPIAGSLLVETAPVPISGTDTVYPVEVLDHVSIAIVPEDLDYDLYVDEEKRVVLMQKLNALRADKIFREDLNRAFNRNGMDHKDFLCVGLCLLHEEFKEVEEHFKNIIGQLSI